MEKGGRIYAKRQKKNMQRKTGRAERTDCFSGSSVKGTETERKRIEEAAKGGGFALSGAVDGKETYQCGQAGRNFEGST
jgi:hypothetical protein